MKKMDAVIMLLLVIAAGLSVALYLRPAGEAISAKILSFPMTIAEWKGKDIPLDDKTYAILETRNVVMREYKNPRGESVYLYIVASDVNRRVAHPPEVCYTGDGDVLLDNRPLTLTLSPNEGRGKGEGSMTINSFVSRKNGSESLVYYWFKAGDKFTTSYLTQQAKSAVNQMMGKNSANALIRVSTDIINGNREKASQILQEFSRILIPALDI